MKVDPTVAQRKANSEILPTPKSKARIMIRPTPHVRSVKPFLVVNFSFNIDMSLL